MRPSAPSSTGALLLLCLLSPAALAQDAAAPPTAPSASSPSLQMARAKMRAACAADVEKYCAGIERANGAFRQCLRDHRAELSSDCIAARAGLRNLRAAEKAKDKS